MILDRFFLIALAKIGGYVLAAGIFLLGLKEAFEWVAALVMPHLPSGADNMIIAVFAIAVCIMTVVSIVDSVISLANDMAETLRAKSEHRRRSDSWAESNG